MPSQLNPPRVPCVQQTARDPRYADETTGALFTPTGTPITTVDSICDVGFVGPFNPPTLGVLTIIGPDECEVGNAAQYRAVLAGKNVEDETYAWTADNGATITPPPTTQAVEVNFNQVGTVTQYRAVLAGKNVEDETYAWTLTPGTGAGTLSIPTDEDTVEANFTGAGTVTIEVTVTSATAGNSPLTASKEVTIS